jgi:multisubunit Na+/H+ antiporter MnhC subunit
VSIEQHMRVVVCRFCGARAEDCGGTCAHATENWKAVGTMVTLSQPLADAACLTSIVIGESKAEVIELPCPNVEASE